MDPNAQLNVGGGQFAQATGGGDALRQAFEKRGIDTSILDNVSESAPGGQNIPGAPATNNIDTQSPVGQSQAQAVDKQPTRSGEMEIALKSLASVVSTENAIAKQTLKFGI